MFADEIAPLAAMLFVAALLYSSVGHGGASAYLAAMGLAGVAPTVMRPTALVLNVVVASIATFKFHRTGAFSARLFVPLALSAVPMAYLGGRIRLPSDEYELLIGVVLVYAGLRSFVTAPGASELVLETPSTPALVAIGGALGFVSGLSGVGGGIFLSPLLLFLRWAPVKVVSGVAAAFIVVNSCAGLLGVMSTRVELHPGLPLWILVVLVGGTIGAELGSRRLPSPTIQRLLALVLLLAAVKMILA